MFSRGGLGDWFARPSTRIAIVLTFVGVLFVLVEAQSPSRLYWTGDAVSGVNSGGIVYYHIDGEQFTVNDSGPIPDHDTPTTVYVDPDDPTQALVDKPTRWVDAASVLVWFVAAALLLILAALRRAWRRSRREALIRSGKMYDDADADWIAHQLERSRQARTDNRSGGH